MDTQTGFTLQSKIKCAAGHMDQLFKNAAGPQQKLLVYTLDWNLQIFNKMWMPWTSARPQDQKTQKATSLAM